MSTRGAFKSVNEMVDDAGPKHTIQVIDRMVDVLSQLERRSGGATIRDLTTQLSLPRTSGRRPQRGLTSDPSTS